MSTPTGSHVVVIGGACALATLLLALSGSIGPELPAVMPERHGTREHAARTVSSARGPSPLVGERETPSRARSEAQRTSARPQDRTRNLLDRLAAFARAGTSGSREARGVAVALLDLVEESPDAVRAVMDRLCSRTCSSVEVSTLIGLLGAAGTPASQRAVIELIEVGAFPLSYRKKAAMAIVQTREPIVGIDRALIRLGQDEPRLVWTTRLALAAVGRRIRESHPERFAEIHARTLADLARARTTRERERALWAIGNLGPRGIPSPVASALTDEDDAIRAAAVDALRRVENRSADRLLLRSATEDVSAQVRLGALHTLVRRHRDGLSATAARETLRSALADAARADPDSQIRKWAAVEVARL